MARSFDSPKSQEWQRRLDRFRKQSLSVEDFCRKEGVSSPSFYQWRKRLATQPSTPAQVVENQEDFKPVRLLAPSSVEVYLPGGTQIRLPGSDVHVLKTALEVLARADADRTTGETPC